MVLGESISILANNETITIFLPPQTISITFVLLLTSLSIMGLILPLATTFRKNLITEMGKIFELPEDRKKGLEAYKEALKNIDQFVDKLGLLSVVSVGISLISLGSVVIDTADYYDMGKIMIYDFWLLFGTLLLFAVVVQYYKPLKNLKILKGITT